VEIGTRVRVVVHLAEQVTVGKTVSQGEAPTQSPTQSTTDQVDQMHVFLKALEDKDMSTSELLKDMRLKHRASFRENYLHPALNKGISNVQFLLSQAVEDRDTVGRTRVEEWCLNSWPYFFVSSLRGFSP
jgi:hypothetical protein